MKVLDEVNYSPSASLPGRRRAIVASIAKNADNHRAVEQTQGDFSAS